MTNNTNTPGRTLEHRIFRSDSKLSSTEINDLLGIKAVIPQNPRYTDETRFAQACNNMLRLAVITLVLAAFALLGSMYQLQIGPFHESEAFASTGS